MNIDCAAKRCPGPAGGLAIFRDKSGAVLGCFEDYYGICDAFHSELLPAMTAIEIANENGWHRLWLEYGSSLMVQASNTSMKISNIYRKKKFLCR